MSNVLMLENGIIEALKFQDAFTLMKGGRIDRFRF